LSAHPAVPTRPAPIIDWSRVHTVLLDMDGTLLDLRFDNTFWLEHVPRRYAERHGLPLERATKEVYQRYRAVEGTIQWYCIDYWTAELDLAIAELKQELEHLIGVHPHALEFLASCRSSGRRVVMVTNAHAKSLALKLERTQLAPYFDAIYSAHELGLPKEERMFWDRLRDIEPFDPASTLLVDDSLSVLRSARAYGIAQLLAVLRPDSQAPRRAVLDFPALETFRDVMPPTP
jgi:putative hydrolase of the HAD superfamily